MLLRSFEDETVRRVAAGAIANLAMNGNNLIDGGKFFFWRFITFGLGIFNWVSIFGFYVASCLDNRGQPRTYNGTRGNQSVIIDSS